MMNLNSMKEKKKNSFQILNENKNISIDEIMR